MTETSENPANNFSWIYPSLTVLVPAFNEGKNIVNTVERVIRALEISFEDYEIIIINDGSWDETGDLADQLAAQHPFIHVFHSPVNKGLGYSYARGVELSNKRLFVYIPGDNSWPYRSILELFGSIGKADIVTSTASNPQARNGPRRIISYGYTYVLNLLFGYRMRYYNGLTIYPTAFLKKNPTRTTGFGFQAEILIKALHMGYSFIEVSLPIDEKNSSGSKAVTLKNVLSVLQTIFQLFYELRLRPWVADREMISKHGRESSPKKGGTIGEAQSNLKDNRRELPSSKKTLRIILTGASSGIGAGIFEALVAEGHMVFACARRSELLTKVTDNHPTAFGWPCDVSDEEQVREFISRVKSETPYVDALINCAGSYGTIGPIDQTDSREWLETMQVNLFGTYLMCKHSLPLLSGAVSAQIINMAGGGAFSPLPNYSAYAASKVAVVRLTECLAMELSSRGIMVNAIAPGFVVTNIHEATLVAGEQRTGKLVYNKTKVLMQQGGVPLSNVISFIQYILSGELTGLTGKTIALNFDRWQTPAFKQNIEEISRSDLFSLRRFNLPNLPDGTLKRILQNSWIHYDPK
jgi:NAD(P)-dependent dehydrogenase (short-subunit alcohol dehydrogenase family)